MPMLKMVVSNRKKGHIFVNADGDKLSMAWFKDRINHYAKPLGTERREILRYYDKRDPPQASCNLHGFT